MSENTGDKDRSHNEDPAEGDTDTTPEQPRVHAEAPAEGADPDDEPDA